MQVVTCERDEVRQVDDAATVVITARIVGLICRREVDEVGQVHLAITVRIDACDINRRRRVQGDAVCNRIELEVTATTEVGEVEHTLTVDIGDVSAPS